MRGEVGGDDSRQLVFIAVGDEVDDGTEHIAVFDDFARLGTKVIYCQDVLVHERPPIFGMRFADVGKVFGIVEADAEMAAVRYRAANSLFIGNLKRAFIGLLFRYLADAEVGEELVYVWNEVCWL